MGYFFIFAISCILSLYVVNAQIEWEILPKNSNKEEWYLFDINEKYLPIEPINQDTIDIYVVNMEHLGYAKHRNSPSRRKDFYKMYRMPVQMKVSKASHGRITNGIKIFNKLTAIFIPSGQSVKVHKQDLKGVLTSQTLKDKEVIFEMETTIPINNSE